MCGSQRPLHIVAISSAFRQSVSGTDWFEIELVNQLLLGLHIDCGENHFTEAIRNGLDAIAAGKNLRDEVALLISSRFLDRLARLLALTRRARLPVGYHGCRELFR